MSLVGHGLPSRLDWHHDRFAPDSRRVAAPPTGPTQEQALRTTALPVASGVVAGGSLMGVVLVFWANVGSILNNLLGG